MQPWARFSLLEELGRTEETSQMHRTEIAQPAIFAMQVALAELWKSWGVEPAAIVGHSVGEIAAACVAGVFSWRKARASSRCARSFMDGCARGEGTMLAVGLGEEEARALIARHDRTVTIAAFNGPRSLTLAGPRLSLEAMLAELEPQGVFARLVRVDHPFHHPLMQPASEALEEALADLAAAGRDHAVFQHRHRRALRRRSLRCRALGPRRPAAGAVCAGGECAWRISAWTCGWKSARIPRSSIRSRNVSPARGGESRRCFPPPAASASTSRCSKRRWICIAPAWRSISRR